MRRGNVFLYILSWRKKINNWALKMCWMTLIRWSCWTGVTFPTHHSGFSEADCEKWEITHMGFMEVNSVLLNLVIVMIIKKLNFLSQELLCWRTSRTTQYKGPVWSLHYEHNIHGRLLDDQSVRTDSWYCSLTSLTMTMVPMVKCNEGSQWQRSRWLDSKKALGCPHHLLVKTHAYQVSAPCTKIKST